MSSFWIPNLLNSLKRFQCTGHLVQTKISDQEFELTYKFRTFFTSEVYIYTHRHTDIYVCMDIKGLFVTFLFSF